MSKAEGQLLREYLKEHRINQEDLAAEMEMTRQGLNYHLRKDKLDHEFKMLLRKHNVKLFTENGKLNKAGDNTPEAASGLGNASFINLGGQTLMYVPLVNQYAYAGYLNGYKDAEFVERLPKVPWLVDKEYKGNYCTFEIRGDSMRDGTEEGYMEGDKVLGREIAPTLWRDKLHIKKWDFIIVHKTEGILLKRIVEHNVERGTLRLHSLNTMFEDFTVSLKDVAQIFNVVQVARKK